MKIRKIAILSIFVSCAFGVNCLESLANLSIPGVRLGFANIFPLLALLLFGAKEAFLVAFARLALSYFLSGNLLALSCATLGTISALSVESVLFLMGWCKSPVTLSVIGAWCFNIGQLFAVYLLLTSAKIFLLAPWILSIGIVTGLAVGIFTKKLLAICKRILQFPFDNNGLKC